MTADVAQEQIVAEAVAGLRQLPTGCCRMEPRRNFQLLQSGPKRIIIARVPSQRASRLGASKDPNETELSYGSPGFLDRFGNVVERDHRNALEALRILLTKIIKPVVIGSSDRGGQSGIDLFPHQDSQPYRGIKGCAIQPFPIHRLGL